MDGKCCSLSLDNLYYKAKVPVPVPLVVSKR